MRLLMRTQQTSWPSSTRFLKFICCSWFCKSCNRPELDWWLISYLCFRQWSYVALNETEGQVRRRKTFTACCIEVYILTYFSFSQIILSLIYTEWWWTAVLQSHFTSRKAFWMIVHALTQFPHLTEGVCYDVELMLTQYAPHAQYFTCMCHKRFQSVKRMLLF